MKTKASEKIILSKVLNGDDEFIQKLRRAKVKVSTFSIDNYGQIFSYTEEMNPDEVNLDLVIEAISNDRELSAAAKQLLSKQARQIAAEDHTSADYSLNQLKKAAQEQDLIRVLHDAVGEFRESRDSEKVFEILERVNAIKSAHAEYERYVYLSKESFDERCKLRSEMNNDSSFNLKFYKLDYFHKYFPNGLPSQAILCIAGQTGVGKSLMAANMAWEAVSPPNGLNVLAITAENRYIEWSTRLDGILLDESPNDLKRDDEGAVEHGRRFFADLGDDWGYFELFKAVPTRFDANTVSQMLDEYIGTGNIPNVVVLDSPDHMVPIGGSKSMQKWERLGQIYWEIKALADMYDVLFVVTAQLTRGAGKEDKKGEQKRIEAEDMGGAYAISQIADAIVAYYKSAQDFLLGRRRIEIVKNRDDMIDSEIISLSLTKSLRLTKYHSQEEITDEIQEQLDAVKFNLKKVVPGE